MAIVSFTLSDESVATFQNVLACILRFSEDVSFDAKREKLVLSALNSTKSAFVSFTFSSSHFTRYKYEGNYKFPDRFYCVLYIRALLSVFRSRAGGDATRGANTESSIERCDVSVDDGPGKKSRFIAKISWRNGITATHALPFEGKAPTHAMFDKSKAANHWSISAHTLRRLMEHFGPKVELLDINTEGNNVINLTCFTEKQYAKTDGLLNMNLHTSIAVKMDEFDFIDVEDKHHIIINVKDFRAVLQHACTTSSSLLAHYSEPWCPLKFAYEENGMFCEFILVTSGNKTDSELNKQRGRTKAGTRARIAFESGSTGSGVNGIDTQMPKPGTMSPNLNSAVSPALQHLAEPIVSGHPDFEIRPQPVPPPTIRIGALYDGDSQWEPVNPEEDNPDFVQIEWDESMQPELSFVPVPINNSQDGKDSAQVQPTGAETAGLEPTQRLTQVRKYGLFQ